MDEKKYLEVQRRIIEKFIPENIPVEIKENTFEWMYFRRELSKESNRGCALLAASHLDYLLEELLKSKLIGSSKFIKNLLDFNGCLGTFSSRIEISYAVGLISKSYMNDLQIIRKIRNQFGHSPTIIDFESEKISALCKNLKLFMSHNTTNRSKFITSVSFISGGLVGSTTSNDNRFKELDEVNIDKIKEAGSLFRSFITDIINDEL